LDLNPVVSIICHNADLPPQDFTKFYFIGLCGTGFSRSAFAAKVNYRDWLSKTPDKTLIHRLADQYNLIVVTPDGGPTSYYFDSPLDKSSRYETFISKEVVEKVDGTYRTVKDRKGRVIAGLSMGGHGAFFIATRHPDIFVPPAA
jgi:S-formylglutathione hydrolase FrmB